MKVTLSKLLCTAKLCVSQSQGRRSIHQGSVKINGETSDLMSGEVEVSPGDKLQFHRQEIAITEEMLRDIKCDSCDNSQLCCEVLLLKSYRCLSCDTEWQDEWYCLCNDRCPNCDEETEPYKHEERSSQ